jgi:Homeodomain-like domain
LRPRVRGGRARRNSTDDEARIVAVARACPDTLGVPYTRWSLAKLSAYLRGEGIEISPAQLGRIFARNGISPQRTRSWKQNADYLRIRPRPRRDGASTLGFMKMIGLAYPRQIRIYWIQDGLSSHWTPEIRA